MELRRWKVLVEHPDSQSFTSEETQFQEERQRAWSNLSLHRALVPF